MVLLLEDGSYIRQVPDREASPDMGEGPYESRTEKKNENKTQKKISRSGS